MDILRPDPVPCAFRYPFGLREAGVGILWRDASRLMRSQPSQGAAFALPEAKVLLHLGHRCWNARVGVLWPVPPSAPAMLLAQGS